MSDHTRPYTPETLAERWSCSSQHIRDLVSKGDLRAFRVGRLIRIRPEEVERYETWQETVSESSNTEEFGASTGEKQENLNDVFSVQKAVNKLSVVG